MPEVKEAKSQDLSKIVEQSVDRLHDMERRIGEIQMEIANLAGNGNATAMGAFSENPAGAFNRFAAAPLQGFAYGAPFAAGVPQMTPLFQASPAWPQGPQAPPGPWRTGAPARSTREFNRVPPAPRVPEVNLVDVGESYTIQVELPGVKKEDLELTATERSITISAEARLELGDGSVLVGEVIPLEYRRTIPLPTACNASLSKANLKNGFLTLTVPKKEPTNGPRRLDVAYG